MIKRLVIAILATLAIKVAKID